MGQGFCPVFLDFLAYYGYNIDVNTWLIFFLSIGAPNPMLSFLCQSHHILICVFAVRIAAFIDAPFIRFHSAIRSDQSLYRLVRLACAEQSHHKLLVSSAKQCNHRRPISAQSSLQVLFPAYVVIEPLRLLEKLLFQLFLAQHLSISLLSGTHPLPAPG